MARRYKETIMFYIDKKTKDRLLKYCNTHEIFISELTRKLLKDWLSVVEQLEKEKTNVN